MGWVFGWGYDWDGSGTAWIMGENAFGADGECGELWVGTARGDCY